MKTQVVIKWNEADVKDNKNDDQNAKTQLILDDPKTCDLTLRLKPYLVVEVKYRDPPKTVIIRVHREFLIKRSSYFAKLLQMEK